MEKDNKLKNKNVKTYTSDMVQAIESDKGGLIKKIIHEEEAHEAEKVNLSPSSKRNRLFMLISFLLIFLAFIILLFLAFSSKNLNTVPVAQQFTSIIFADQTDFKAIDGLNKDQIFSTILNQVANTDIKAGGVEGIYLTENKKVIGFKEFITLLKTNFSMDQINLVSDNFLLGALNSVAKPVASTDGSTLPTDKNTKTLDKGLFILLKVRSFTDIFPVMQVWEDKMLYDLSSLFKVNISPDTNYLFTKDWEDGVVSNKNARILRDKNGNIVLMYVFLNDSSLLITNSEAATNEVILRLNSSQIKK